MPARAIFFDFDDTLHDFTGSFRHAFAAGATAVCPGVGPAGTDQLREACREPWDELWQAFVTGGLDEDALWAGRAREVLERCGRAAEPELIQLFRDHYTRAMLGSLRLFPDASGALELARGARPVPILAILTNGPRSVQRQRLQHLGLDRLTSFQLISGELGVAKPQRAYFARALELAAVPARDAVMIGDNPATDIAGARDTGLHAVWLNRAGLPWPGPGEPPPEAPSVLAAVRWALDTV